MEKPPTLEYQTLSPMATKTRRFTARFAQFTGSLNFFLGMGLLAYFFSTTLPNPCPHALRTGFTLMAVNAGACVICGTMYLIGGFIIHRPHSTWETTLTICILVHSLFVLLVTGWWAFFNRDNTLWIWGLGVFFHPFPVLAFLFEALRRTRRGN